MKKRLVSFFLSLALVTSICSNAFAASSMLPQQVLQNDDGSKTTITQVSPSERTITFTNSDNELDYTIALKDEENIRTSVMVTDQYTIRSVTDTTKKFTSKMYMKPTGAPDSAYELVVDITEDDLQSSGTSGIIPYDGMTSYHHGTFFEYDYYTYQSGKRELYINHTIAVAPPGKFNSECKTFYSSSLKADDGMKGVLCDLIGTIPVVGPFTSGCFDIIFTTAIADSKEDAIASLLIDYAWQWADELAIKHIPGISVISASLSACRMIYHCNRVHTSWNTVKKG